MTCSVPQTPAAPVEKEKDSAYLSLRTIFLGRTLKKRFSVVDNAVEVEDAAAALALLLSAFDRFLRPVNDFGGRGEIEFGMVKNSHEADTIGLNRSRLFRIYGS